MLNVLLLFAGFIFLTGLAMLVYKFTEWKSGECLMLAVSAVILIQFIAGVLGNIMAGTILLYVAGFAGIVVFIFKKGKQRRRDFFSPGYVFTALIFLYAAYAFRNILFFNWDEFNQWGKAVRYIMETNSMPAGPLFTSGSYNPPGTTFFHVFFMRLTGFVEGNAYISNAVLVGTAIMLPFSSVRWKEWGKVFIGGITIIAGIFSLYVYPYMSIYVDLPVSLWSASIVAWWYIRKDKLKILALPIVGFCVISLMKRAVGPLFIILALLFILLMSVPGQKERIKAIFKKYALWFLLAIPAIALGCLLWGIVSKSDAAGILPGINSVGDTLKQLFTLSTEKARLTVQSGLDSLFSVYLNNNSNLHLAYLPSILGMFGISLIIRIFIRDVQAKKKYTTCMIAYLIGSVVYFGILMYIYINTFPEPQSIIVSAINRYYSVYVILGFVMTLMPLFAPEEDMDDKQSRDKSALAKRIIAWLLLAFMLVGCLNQNFLLYSSSFRKKEIPNYEMRVKIRDVAKDLNTIVKDNESIYMVAQETNGKALDIACYELGLKLMRPGICYDFLNGNRQNKSLLFQFNINQLPQYLAQKGYDYLWLYRTNDYFNKKLKDEFGIKNAKTGYLYKISVKNGKAVLKYIGKYV